MATVKFPGEAGLIMPDEIQQRAGSNPGGFQIGKDRQDAKSWEEFRRSRIDRQVTADGIQECCRVGVARLSSKDHPQLLVRLAEPALLVEQLR